MMKYMAIEPNSDYSDAMLIVSFNSLREAQEWRSDYQAEELGSGDIVSPIVNIPARDACRIMSRYLHNKNGAGWGYLRSLSAEELYDYYVETVEKKGV